MLLGEAVEQVAGMPLNRFCRERIFRPLGIRATDFIDISLVRIAPARAGGRDVRANRRSAPFRKRLLVGEVDDENAYAMGGVAGHAGLFAPVREVDRIARELLACYAGRSELAAAECGAGVLDPRHYGQRIDLGARMGLAVDRSIRVRGGISLPPPWAISALPALRSGSSPNGNLDLAADQPGASAAR